jgi:hypothetical protein
MGSKGRSSRVNSAAIRSVKGPAVCNLTRVKAIHMAAAAAGYSPRASLVRAMGGFFAK